MKFSKQIVSLLLATIMIFGLAACGGTSTQSGSNGGTVTKNESMKDVINSIPKELKGTTIKYFMWYDGEKETEGPVINAFELESGIKVDVEVGFVWNDLITNLERVADHCSNVAGCVIDLKDNNMNLHESLKLLKSDNEFYRDKYNEYSQKYLSAI